MKAKINNFMNKNYIKIMIILTITILVNITILFYKEVKFYNKMKFYEEVLKEFDIGEFIEYPELFDSEEYIEQVKVHNCMWAIDELIECENKLYEENIND